MATIGMLYICTGKYTVFWPEFYETFSRNFFTRLQKKNTLSLPMHRPSLTRMTPLCTALTSPPMTGR
ncbi:MAG: hypothetical protein ACLRX3_05545 [Subdoligranulum sp.]